MLTFHKTFKKEEYKAYSMDYTFIIAKTNEGITLVVEEDYKGVIKSIEKCSSIEAAKGAASMMWQHFLDAEESSPSIDELQKSKSLTFVKAGGFSIAKAPVTQEVWQAVMGDNPAYHTTWINQLQKKSIRSQRPVERVSWYDVQEFIKRLNTLTGEKYRLPTVKEWESAANGNQKTLFAGSDDADAVAWYAVFNRPSGTKPVGLKRPNELGLYDMSGNVWEWCHDAKTTEKPVKGGSYSDMEHDCIVKNTVFVKNFDEKFKDVGFRLAMDA